jgi:hypothetical protein
VRGAGVQERAHPGLGRCFGVDAQDGLGSRLAEEQPRFVREEELRAVGVFHARDVEVGEAGRRRVVQLGDEREAA